MSAEGSPASRSAVLSDRMRKAAGRNAKNPAVAFEDDRSSKQVLAAPELRLAAQRWLALLFERLRHASRKTALAG